MCSCTPPDILARRARQQGKSVLTASVQDVGIATQLKFEQALKKDGLSRRDLGREKFIDHAKMEDKREEPFLNSKKIGLFMYLEKECSYLMRVTRIR